MQIIIDEEVVEILVCEGYFYIMYCFNEEERKFFIKCMYDKGLIVLILVGVKDYEYDFVISLKEDVFEFIIIDIVYGYFNSVIEMI